ncbi:TIGR02996 domain-containing protein [Gemmata sp. G18]|uniref:TIGR02996 domain-containing protein n=1 Tax=Gemmata palustris TaxID=2822762 RepID=A0ABS5BYR8_9BACT|nr:TIGR02996 domain-containing protein [Gemmata palustris]MBP3958884.1 TIGR02996 domain-containing protein [Gemmata palustris]
MWVPFDTFGEVRGRVRGVSLPYPNGQVLVWTDQGLFSLWYFRSAFINKLTPTTDAKEHFDPTTGAVTWNGSAYPMLGACAPQNDSRAHTRHPGGERVVLDPTTGAVHLLDAAGAVQQVIEVAGAGEWAVAAFSVDGKALVVADSTGVRAFRYEATTGGERPRWAALASESDQNRLLRAVLANPDEDTPRLMYADWLDEHDDPARAEFIRVQCRLAERSAHEAVPASDPDQQREFQLALQLGERWRAELPAVRGVRWTGFWRGFPGVAVVSPTTLVRAAPKLWAVAPVEWVTITGLNQNGARLLADSEVFDRLRVLTLDGYHIQREGEKPFARCSTRRAPLRSSDSTCRKGSANRASAPLSEART